MAQEEAQQTQEVPVEQSHDINVNAEGTQASVTPKSMEEPANESTQSEETKTEPVQSQPTTEEVQQEYDKQQQSEADLKADLEKKGVNWDNLASEYDTKGELSKESLDALEKAGYPKSVVDAYLAGLQATTERFVSQVKSFAGGEEGFKQLQTFMQSQPKAVIDAFNSLIQGGNLGQIQLAVEGIKAQMVAKYGTANPTVMGQGSAQNTPQGYTTPAQMTKDMRDPRYQVDPVFTREVMRKVQNATFF